MCCDVGISAIAEVQCRRVYGVPQWATAVTSHQSARSAGAVSSSRLDAPLLHKQLSAKNCKADIIHSASALVLDAKAVVDTKRRPPQSRQSAKSVHAQHRLLRRPDGAGCYKRTRNTCVQRMLQGGPAPAQHGTLVRYICLMMQGAGVSVPKNAKVTAVAADPELPDPPRLRVGSMLQAARAACSQSWRRRPPRQGMATSESPCLGSECPWGTPLTVCVPAHASSSTDVFSVPSPLRWPSCSSTAASAASARCSAQPGTRGTQERPCMLRDAACFSTHGIESCSTHSRSHGSGEPGAPCRKGTAGTAVHHGGTLSPCLAPTAKQRRLAIFNRSSS